MPRSPVALPCLLGRARADLTSARSIRFGAAGTRESAPAGMAASAGMASASQARNACSGYGPVASTSRQAVVSGGFANWVMSGRGGG